MEFNSEQTLKEVNVYRVTNDWTATEEGYLWPSGKCMEINCAFGYTTRYFLLPELCGSSIIIGTDSSEKMIDNARKKYKNDDRIEFNVLDIQTKNLPEEYIAEFDYIFSFPTVHSRNDIVQEFKNVYNMLKPGGMFLVSMVTSHDAFTLYEHMANHSTFGSYFKKHTVSFRDPEREVKQLLARLGFVIKYCCPVPNMKYKTDYLLPYIFFGLPFINELSFEQQKNLKDELAKSYNKIEKRIDRVRSNVSNKSKFDYRDVYDVLQVYARKPRTTST